MRKVLDRGGFDEKLGNALERLKGPRLAGSLGGSGFGSGTGAGPRQSGTGTSTRGGAGLGGGGKSHADAVTHGPLDTGGTRAARGKPGGRGIKEAEVVVDVGSPDGDLGGLTAAEILKVVKSRRNAIKNCYERALQRSKGLGGKVVITWRILADGAVKGAKVRSTSVRNGSVEDCVVRQISALEFPPPKNGQVAVVNFPFLFAPTR
jgi:TonB family protein